MINITRFYYLLLSLSLSLFSLSLHAEPASDADIKVRITKDIPYVDIVLNGKKTRIERIQDTSNRLSNSFSKTSRPCPPFCIRPISIGRVKTVGELEVLDFLQNKVVKGEGVLIDSRIPQWFEKGSIPGAINIPFTILNSVTHKKHNNKILSLLGVTDGEDGKDFSNARELMLFCNGAWCSQATRAITLLISQGYPEEKLYWYRGGIQDWLSLGFSITKP